MNSTITDIWVRIEKLAQKYGVKHSNPDTITLNFVKQVIDEEWVFTFGKHKGEKLKNVGPSYIVWCCCNIGWFSKAIKPEIKQDALQQMATIMSCSGHYYDEDDDYYDYWKDDWGIGSYDPKD